MTLTGQTDYRAVLKKELEHRCRKSPGYSLRAFARDLKLAPSRLSEVLSGKQGLSRERAIGIASSIGLAEKEAEIFADLVDAQHARAKVARDMAKLRVEKHQLDTAYHALQEDAFSVIADWYHFAILQLDALKDFKHDVSWIARKLSVSPAEAQLALERLERLKLIEFKNGKIKVLQERVSVGADVPSRAIRTSHRQLLERAMIALETQSVENRDFSAIFVPISAKQVSDAKRWIKRFRRSLGRKLSDESQPADAVYCYSTQFFSLTQDPRGET